MKIYRYVPNGCSYPSIVHTLSEQWWPDGIRLGRALSRLYPKSEHGSRWVHEGNVFSFGAPGATHSDFPALALHAPILSERAATLLASAGLIVDPVPITVSGLPHFAVQPLLASVSHGLPACFDAEASIGLALPRGEIFHFHTRAFDQEKVPGEFFSIPQFEPYSDLYVTERLVDLARSHGLLGLEHLELVFDSAPVMPRYAPLPRTALPASGVRAELEWELLSGRCDFMSYDTPTIAAAIEDAACEGHVALDRSQLP